MKTENNNGTTEAEAVALSRLVSPCEGLYVIKVYDGHGKQHVFGPISLVVEAEDTGDAWDNVADLESKAMEQVIEASETVLYVPSVHDSDLKANSELDGIRKPPNLKKP